MIYRAQITISGVYATSEAEAHGGGTEESVCGEAYCSRHVMYDDGVMRIGRQEMAQMVV